MDDARTRVAKRLCGKFYRAARGIGSDWSDDLWWDAIDSGSQPRWLALADEIVKLLEVPRQFVVDGCEPPKYIGFVRGKNVECVPIIKTDLDKFLAARAEWSKIEQESK